MLWKERYVARMNRSTKLALVFILLMMVAILGYTTHLVAVPAFNELGHFGYGWNGEVGVSDVERSNFNVYLRVMGCIVYLTWVLSATSAAASSVTSEREEDTWLSLTSTPLEGWEIVRAKMFGAFWATRGLGLLLLTLWAVGLLAGSIHPFGLLAVIVETAVFLSFAIALGTFLSLKSKSSSRAMAATIGILLILNGGYLLCCIPLQPESSMILAGVTPVVEVFSLVTYREFWDVFHGAHQIGSEWIFEAVMTCIISTLAYGTATLVLTLSAVAGFDHDVDRPYRAASDALRAVPATPVADQAD
jgi:hypothetical protein